MAACCVRSISFAKRAPGYDRENRFFSEDFEELKQAGYLTCAVPKQLGGGGLTFAQVMAEQRRLATHAHATALGINMHLYWTGVAWGGGLLLSTNPLPRIGELMTVRALLTRALELDDGWEGGTIHEAMIALESLPALLGGSAARAREHFNRAVALANGESAFAYVALATGVASYAGNRCSECFGVDG